MTTFSPSRVRFRSLLAGLVLLLAACSDSPTEPGSTPVILSITPDILEPGGTFTISGEAFPATTADTRVRVHGVEATVLEVSGTSLTARLPQGACLPEGSAPVVVFAGTTSSEPFGHPVRGGEALELSPGEFRGFGSADGLCVVLDASDEGAEYVFGIQSRSTTAAARTPVRVRGWSGQAASSAAAQRLTAARSATTFAEEAHRRAWSDPGASDRDRRWERHREAKPTLRQAEAAAMAQIRRNPVTTFRSASPPSRVPADVEVGDTVQLNVPDINASICNDAAVIDAVVRRVGVNSVWIDDIENPSGGFTDDDYALLSREFDHEIYEEVVSYFGEPTDMDENGRIVIVATRKVNEMSANTLGFVVSSDFFPNSCSASNGGEYYYTRAVDPQGSITDPDGDSFNYPRQDALADAPLILAHEVTHIVQFGRRFHTLGLSSAQAIWLLEGQATLAEEVVGHRYTGQTPGSNLDEFTAFSPADPRGETFWYRNPFTDLSLFYGVGFGPQGTFKVQGAPQECGWLRVTDPEPCISGRIAYGNGWSLLRWMSDHFGSRFGGGEREMQRRIVDSEQTGFATLNALVDEDIFDLLVPWAASQYTEGRIEDGDPLLTLPSWDLRSIEAWLSHPSRWGSPARLDAVDHGFGSFDREFVVAAGSSTYQTLSSGGSHPSFAVFATATDGGSLPGFMQLWIARIR